MSSDTQTASASPPFTQEFHQSNRDKKIKGSHSRRKSSEVGKGVYRNAAHNACHLQLAPPSVTAGAALCGSCLYIYEGMLLSLSRR